MVDGLQSSEHGSPAQTLEVILADVEHRGPDQWEVSIVSVDQSEASCDDLPEVKLVEELSDENVHLQHIGHIFSLNVPEKNNHQTCSSAS